MPVLANADDLVVIVSLLFLYIILWSVRKGEFVAFGFMILIDIFKFWSMDLFKYCYL